MLQEGILLFSKIKINFLYKICQLQDSICYHNSEDISYSRIYLSYSFHTEKGFEGKKKERITTRFTRCDHLGGA